MTDRETLFNLLADRKEFLARVTERLGTYPSDFGEQGEAATASPPSPDRRLAAGVLLPLLFVPPAGQGAAGGFCFRLIKRSSLVTQPGDLSCPGGMVHPWLDRLLRFVVAHGPLPVLRGPARAHVLARGAPFFRVITLFLATALRETWEEIGLPPWRVGFLGPLPSYRLTRFRRRIFPLAGSVEAGYPPRPNREVELIVDIPLASFYQERQIGCFNLSVSNPGAGEAVVTRHPCLIHRSADGGEEILWGATFHIITRFLSIVLDYRLPEWLNGPVVSRQLSPGYLRERSRR